MVDRIVDAEHADSTVDKKRRRKRHEKSGNATNCPAAVYTRADALADLARRNGSALRFSDLLNAFDGVCQNCGMGNFADICAACPLPQFINNLVKGESRAPHELQREMVDAAARA